MFSENNRKQLKRIASLIITAIVVLLVGQSALTNVGSQSNVVSTGANQPATDEISWDYEADVVVVGAGASGLTAALKALDDGASVLLVEANFDVGGHVAVSEGQFHSGGGTIDQDNWGIEDSADLYYYDHTRGTSINSRYNDPEYTRSIANAMAETYDWLLDNGIKTLDVEPMVRAYYRDGGNDGDSVGRMTYVDASDWENTYTGTEAAGIGISRPIEQTLRQEGAQFLLNYHMDKIYRDGIFEGQVTGIQASYSPTILPGETEPLQSLMSDGNIEENREIVNIKANKAVIICTGGSTGNVEFRTMLDPRLGEYMDGLAGMPFSDQDASGEYAAMEIGAALGSLGNYTSVVGANITAPQRFGTQYGYGRGWTEDSVIWPLVRTNGIVPDYNSLVIVNMVGERIGNEDQYAMAQMDTAREPFFDQALTGTFIDLEGDGNAEAYGGPLWAIMDQAAVDRNGWDMEAEGVLDYAEGYAFKADTLEELADMVVNKYYEDVEMDPATLVDTITRYNGFVDAGNDEDWQRETTLVNKIEEGPFYALWATPSMHDTLAGIRVDGNMQVVDIYGQTIPNLFAAGEASGGMRVHGLGRVMTSGYVAGRAAASVDEEGFATADTALNEAHAGAETNHLTKTNKAEYFSYRGLSQGTMTHSEKMAEIEAWEQADDSETDTEEAVEADDVSMDNVFEGQSNDGFGGRVRIQITVDGDQITDIQILEQSETVGIGVEALDALAEQALVAQSAELDVVSGATVSSNAFMEALQNAMETAGLP
ncbi:FAD-dependent oxidoreductase [Fundicoccus culcitae]|uniref:Urocanate reductase n=1 Tax=Fundicoccus culcitae TaxID=2969821 RepID=A0ABY5P7S2_9LACT|nr:FAD-dependent oxidoreductase [Fundicoccus culcitae]UUX34782.1 FAD-dependent oxidoreductase [Fundicoccus culcitae]